MLALKLLPGVDQGGALQEVEHGGVVFEGRLVPEEGGDAGLVVVFQEAELVVVCGVGPLLVVQHIEIMAEGDLPLEVFVEDLPDVVLILQVEGGVGVVVQGRGDAVPAGQAAEAQVHRLRQPDTVRVDLGHLCPGVLPEFEGHEGGHVAAEAVHDLRPAHQGLRQVVPEAGVGVVQVDDIRPVAHLVAGPAVGTPVEELRMLPEEDGVRGGMVVDHVDHALHAPRVDGVHQGLEVLHGAVGGVHGPVVPVGVGAAEAALLPSLPDGVDGQEPDDVRAEGLDPVQIRDHGAEGALRRVVPDVDGVDDLILKTGIGVLCHNAASLQPPKGRFFCQKFNTVSRDCK